MQSETADPVRPLAYSIKQCRDWCRNSELYPQRAFLNISGVWTKYSCHRMKASCHCKIQYRMWSCHSRLRSWWSLVSIGWLRYNNNTIITQSLYYHLQLTGGQYNASER